MELINISGEHVRYAGDKKGLDKFILLPDYSPGKGLLSVGTVAIFDRKNHEINAEYLGPDIGCGMLLAKFSEDFDLEHLTYKIGTELRENSGELGSLGSGNHFINFYCVINADELTMPLSVSDYVALIHSGSRRRGKQVYEQQMKNAEYLKAHDMAVDFGKKNRQELVKLIEKCADQKLIPLYDRTHNTIEINDNKIIYRKGAMKLEPGEIGVMPSSMAGNALLVKGKEKIKELENSMCHGTGRKISRKDAKGLRFDSGEIREKICIPNFIYDSSIKTDAPHCYRTIEEVELRIKKYVDIIGRLKPKAYVC